MTKLSRRLLTFLLVPLLGALVATALPASPASAAIVNGVALNSTEAALVRYINNARQKAGIAPVLVRPGTTDVARRWARYLSTTQVLKHNPSFASQVAKSGSARWGRITENVGYGSACDPAQLFNAYMNSPGHRRNILDRKVRYLGIGAVDRTAKGWPCGQVWNTMNFVDYYQSSYGQTRVAPTAQLNR
ncbi:MAG TPA: CAP domain-containing protein [Mycobacteriales bacterium]|jgi:uncharacterized protein YkwD